MKYDLESLLKEIEDVLRANLNNKLEQIDLEKNDSVVLAKVDADAYFMQQLNGKMANWNPIVLYGVDDISPVASGPRANNKVSISVVIIVADTGQDVEIGARMFRYSRAMQEVFQENWQTKFGVKLEIKPQIPVPLTNLNTAETFRAVGVTLDANIG